jgi:AcrR family transcriptional regulator
MEKKGSKKKKEIIETAYKMFCEKGFDATTIRDLCKATNLTAPGLYHHIKNKEELFIEVERHVFKEFEVLFDKANYGKNCREDLENFIKRYCEVVLSHKKMFFLIMEKVLLQRDNEYAEESRNRRKDFVKNLKHVLERAKEKGNGRKEINVVVATFSMIAMINWLSIWYNPEAGISKGELIESMVNLFTNGFFLNNHKIL